MSPNDSPGDTLQQENATLRSRLDEFKEILRAIRSGEADAIAVDTPAGQRVVTLSGAEQPWRVMVEAMSEGAVTATPDGIILYCNQRFADMIHSDLRTIIGSSLLEHLAGDDAAALAAAMRDVGSGTPRLRTTLLTADATTVPVNIAMHGQSDGDVPSLAIVVTDLTEVLRGEVARERAIRALHMLKACNDIMTRATDEERLLADICGAMVAADGYKLVWVGYAEHDAAKSVRPVASAGDDGGYVAQARISWADTERGRGPTGTAIRTGRTTIVRDTDTQPNYEPWRRMAHDKGFRSSATIALPSDHGVFGAIMIYSGRPDAFDEDETQLLDELAGSLVYAIVALRNKIARDRLASIVESASVAIVVRDLAGRVASWNKAAERMFGYAAAEIIGRSSEMLVPPEIAGEANWLFEKVRRGETVERLETIRVAKDGRRIPVELTFSPVRDGAGNIMSIAVLMHDNTARKNAEEALQFREARLRAETTKLRSILDSMAEAVVVADAHGNIIESNPAARRMHGADALEASVERWADRAGLRAPDATKPLASAQNPLVRALRGEPTDGAPLSIARPDGALIQVEATGRPILGTDGSIGGGLVVLSDITERTLAADRLRRTALYARGLLEASLDPLVTISADGKITDVNKATENVIGLPRDRLIGSDFSDYFTQPDRAHAVYRQVFAEGSVTDYPLAIRHVSGRIADVLYNASTYRDEHGAVAHCLA